MSAGEIALNLLPLVSKAKPFTTGWFIVETANWGGQIALMGASAVDMARQLQATQVAALAEEYQAFLELQKTSLPSDPGLELAEARIRRKAEAVDGEITRQFWAQVKGNFFQMVAGSVIHNMSAEARTAIIDHLTSRPAATASAGDGVPPAGGGGDTPPAPPPPSDGDPAPTHTPTPDAPAPKPDVPTPRPDAPAPRRDKPDAPAPDPDGPVRTPDKDAPTAPVDPTAPPPKTSKIAAEAAGESRMRPDGNGDFRAEAGDLHNVHHAWAEGHVGDTVTPIHYDPDTNTAHFDARRRARPRDRRRRPAHHHRRRADLDGEPGGRRADQRRRRPARAARAQRGSPRRAVRRRRRGAGGHQARRGHRVRPR
jgi:hypothetical protein